MQHGYLRGPRRRLAGEHSCDATRRRFLRLGYRRSIQKRVAVHGGLNSKPGLSEKHPEQHFCRNSLRHAHKSTTKSHARNVNTCSTNTARMGRGGHTRWRSAFAAHVAHATRWPTHAKSRRRQRAVVFSGAHTPASIKQASATARTSAGTSRASSGSSRPSCGVASKPDSLMLSTGQLQRPPRCHTSNTANREMH
jgi:hypothetical protein